MLITDKEGQEVEDMMVEVTERAAGHYEVQKVEFGKVYRWPPGGGVVPECCSVVLLSPSRRQAALYTPGATPTPAKRSG